MYGTMVQLESYNNTDAIRLENIARFSNRSFSPHRILLSQKEVIDRTRSLQKRTAGGGAGLATSEINNRLQSKQAGNPYNKNYGKINSATVQAISWINGSYDPNKVLRKLISDKTNPHIEQLSLKNNPYFQSQDELIIAFALEHNDTVLAWNKNETAKIWQNVLDQDLFNEATSVKNPSSPYYTEDKQELYMGKTGLFVRPKASPKKDKIINAPANVAKKTDEDTVREVIDKQVIEIPKVKESPQTLEDERPEIQVSTNYYLIGLVALLAVSLFFLMRMKK